MVGRIATALLVVGLTACTEIPPAPGTGGAGGGSGAGGSGGEGGNGGDLGGTGGAAGMGGTAGSGGGGGIGVGGAGGADPCVVFPEEANNVEPGDTFGAGFAMGSVSGACAMGACTGDDPFDRWSVATCGGEHSIIITWDDIDRDLDLYLVDSDDVQIGQSATPATTSETISADLLPDDPYVIEVQVFDTGTATQSYRLEIMRLEL